VSFVIGNPPALLFQSLAGSTGIFGRRDGAGLSKVARQSKVALPATCRLAGSLNRCLSASSRPAFYNQRQMTLVSSFSPFIDWRWLWLSAASFLAGILNAVAGGGSFLLFPAMLGMKILPIQANATNTVALWPGQLTSIAAYRDDIGKNPRLVLPMALAGLLGGTVGAVVLLSTPQMTFLHLVPWLLLTAASIFAVSGPVSRWLEERKIRSGGQIHPPHRLAVFFGTIAVCFYIGYFGAGAGFLLITLLSLFGYQDLHEINALKVVSTYPGQRQRRTHLHGQRPGSLALLPAGHGHLRHRRLHLGPLRTPHSATGAARAGRFARPFHGRMVLLEKSLA
jgi:uncharacterized membrane protein YfcA